ncbi:transposase [Streptomyces sp. NBC_01218]|nr:transposase [Streptomyces sp. NBC_01218]WSQ55586.1 transposase [Streptomyces sp. NBC_01218]
MSCTVRRHEPSDAEREVLSGLLPAPLTGRPRRDDRLVLNGIVWKLRTRSAWRDVHERYGPTAEDLPLVNKQLCKHRNVAERRFNRLKQYRAIATRYDRARESREAAVTIASLPLGIRPL